MNYLNEYLEFLQSFKGLRFSTAKSYHDKVSIFLNHSEKKLKDLTQQDLINFISSIKKKKVTNATHRHYVTSLKSYFSFLNKYYNLPDIAQELRPPKAETKFPNILKVDEVESMILSVGISSPLALRNSAILCLLADTGIRVSELIQLRFGHVQKEKCQLILNVSHSKTYRSRQIPFCYYEQGGLVAEYFLAYYTFLLQKGCRSEDYLFQTDPYHWIKTKDGFRAGKENPQGVHPLTRISIFNIIKKAAKNVGLDFLPSPHSFRHFYATYLAVNGLDVHKIKQRLGHSNLDRTQIYIHYADIVKNDSARNNPLSGKKAGFSGFAKLLKENS